MKCLMTFVTEANGYVLMGANTIITTGRLIAAKHEYFHSNLKQIAAASREED